VFIGYLRVCIWVDSFMFDLYSKEEKEESYRESDKRKLQCVAREKERERHI